ncbi:MAG TPA: hypothetical protein DCR03_03715 [Gammaproteobacteria bacterium]|nr:hypothetical protein [Gammaproteobacteria bacterium]
MLLLLFYLHYAERQVEETFLSHAHKQIGEQIKQVDSLILEVEGEHNAVGRSLAMVESRILRVEALGERLSVLSGIEDEEFRFGYDPPSGGPLNISATNINQESKLYDLISRVERKRRELQILEAIITNKQLFNDASPAGKPVKWGWISSPYGERLDPLTGRPAWHNGMDFAGRPDSEVVVVASGIVVHVGRNDSYGQVIDVGHGGGYLTRYAHHKEALVRRGDVVRKGDVIALMGNSGRTTGPHVHFEILKDGTQIDPTSYVTRSR